VNLAAPISPILLGVGPAGRNQSANVTTHHENHRIQLPVNCPDGLETVLTILLANGRDNQYGRIKEDAGGEGKRNALPTDIDFGFAVVPVKIPLAFSRKGLYGSSA
jgi:hypothetical protein